MMSKHINDLSEQTINDVYVIKYAETNKWGQAMFLCRCKCGNEFTAIGSNIKSGATKSCGCLQRETAREQMLAHGSEYAKLSKGSLIHGETKTKLHNHWCQIKRRCSNPAKDNYKYYGGRGISVCDEWANNYLAFKEWAVKNGYRDDLSLERIDVNGNYEPSNCCWIEFRLQPRNRRNTLTVEHDGVSKPFAEWCEIYQKNYKTSHEKYKKGYSFGKIFGLDEGGS